MTWNPYVTQIARQTGMSEHEVRRESRKAAKPITDEEARSRGYRDADAYLEDLYDFLNGM